ncbi:MAG: CRISPR-associated protein Cas4 [Bryobacteraceae bacterium]
MYTEDELLPLSSLQHLAFCERQWALIHLEQSWAENRRTAEGAVLHERAHDPGFETRRGVRAVRGLRVHSLRLGISGQTDVVEFAGAEEQDAETRRRGGQRGEHGFAGAEEIPYPIEYKRGRPKVKDWDLVQLCAQGLCLEEMTRRAVPAGALFYGELRRRMEVRFDPPLRARTERLAARLHDLWRAGRTPPPFARGCVEEKRCGECSLVSLCVPRATGADRDVHRYIQNALRRMGDSDRPGEG